MNRPITRNFCKPVGAEPDRTYDALLRFEARPRLEEALSALGVSDRVISSHRLEVAPHRAVGHALVWRLANGGRAEITWTACVSTDGGEGSVISLKMRASADSAASRTELLAAWPLLGRMAESHARRMISAVAELADRFPEDHWVPGVRVPVRRAA
ncbi:MAG TPA: hypothetical protein VJU60_07110 [Thermoleophilaceae bacterium]|nr:hypothetical protein [Thermoleophilaceae bacterium]